MKKNLPLVAVVDREARPTGSKREKRVSEKDLELENDGGPMNTPKVAEYRKKK